MSDPISELTLFLDLTYLVTTVNIIGILRYKSEATGQPVTPQDATVTRKLSDRAAVHHLGIRRPGVPYSPTTPQAQARHYLSTVMLYLVLPCPTANGHITASV